MKIIETEYVDGVYQPVSVTKDEQKIQLKTVKQKKKEIRKAKVHKVVSVVSEFIQTFEKIYNGASRL